MTGMQDAWRAYFDMALGLTAAPRNRARRIAADLVNHGGATAVQLQGLVEELPRQPGQKERRWRHLLGSGAVPAAAARREVMDGVAAQEAPARHATEAEPAAMTGPASATPVDGDLHERVAALERRVDELADILERLTR